MNSMAATTFPNKLMHEKVNVIAIPLNENSDRKEYLFKLVAMD